MCRMCELSLHLLCFKKGCSSPSSQPLSREILKCCGCKIQPPPPVLMTTLCMSHKGAAYTVSAVPRLKFALILSPHCWLPHSCPHLWQKISHWELEAEASGSHEATSRLLEKPHKTDVSAYLYIFKEGGQQKLSVHSAVC